MFKSLDHATIAAGVRGGAIVQADEYSKGETKVCVVVVKVMRSHAITNGLMGK
jgi:hypothetical protein